MIKSLVLQWLEKLVSHYGYTMIPARRWEELKKLSAHAKSADSTAVCLGKLVKEYDIDCVFDVGANDGGFAEMLRSEAGYTGWIISFEPLEKVARALAKKAESDPRWEVMTDALGRSQGEMEFHQMAGDVFSSFLMPDTSQPDKYSSSNKVVQSIQMKVNTINHLWPQIRERLGVRRMLLKMDTQGFDLEVFAGADAQLQDIPVLMSELSFVRIYKDSPSYQEALTAFAKAGYAPALLSPISFDQHHAAIEMDAILVRSLA